MNKISAKILQIRVLQQNSLIRGDKSSAARPIAAGGIFRYERAGKRGKEKRAIIVHQIVFLALDTRFKTQSAAVVRDHAARNHDQIYRSPRAAAPIVSLRAKTLIYASNQYCHLTVRGAHVHFPFSQRTDFADTHLQHADISTCSFAGVYSYIPYVSCFTILTLCNTYVYMYIIYKIYISQ